MTPYSGSSAGPFNTAIGLVDTTDVVQGGLSGTSNVATKKLADNDAYLYKIMGGFENIVQLSNAGPITSVNITVANLKRNQVIMYQAANGYFEGVLPGCSTVRIGDVACIRRLPVGHFKPVKISTTGGDGIYDKYNNNLAGALYLHDGEIVWLYNTGSAWIIMNFEGNLYRSMEQHYGYRQEPGTLIRNGQVINRADYPRLWAIVNSIGSPLVVSDGAWTGSTDNRGYFSSGNGTTTFRLPDDRGLFDRSLDLSAGVDADRAGAGTGSAAGSYQADEFRAHTHGINVPVFAGTAGVGSGAHADNGVTAFAGGTETRPVNVAKVPLVVY